MPTSFCMKINVLLRLNTYMSLIAVYSTFEKVVWTGTITT